MEAERQHRERAGGSARSDIPDRLARDLDRDQLSQLVRAALDEHVDGRRTASLATLADRAAAAGHPVSRGYLHKMAAGTVAKTPTPEQLAGIAAAVGRPLEIVKAAAAAQYLDYETTELGGYPDDVRVVVAHLAGMTPIEQRRWRAMIEADERARRSNNSNE
jgi:transcriptional regulator with XRE-family HTH domain